MLEKIEVRYKPIILPGGLFFHKYIIYTDKNGNQWIARGGPEYGDGYRDRGGIPEDQLRGCRAEPFGNLVTEVKEYTELNNLDWRYPDQTPHSSHLVDEGVDLSDRWFDIVGAMNTIHAERHSYLFGTQNSNSAVDTALIRSGYDVPFSLLNPLSPGHGDVLPTEPFNLDGCDLIRGGETWVGTIINRICVRSGRLA